MKRIISVITLAIMVLTMSTSVFAAGSITKKAAVNIALKDSGYSRSEVKKLDAEKGKKKFEVEFTVKADKTEYDYEISKKGTILEKSVEFKYEKDSSEEKIGKKAARKKVAEFSGIPYETVAKGSCKYEYDDDDNEGTYEVKFRKGSYKYEFEVLAPTGAIIDYEMELKK